MGHFRALMMLVLAIMATVQQASAAKPVMFADFLAKSATGSQKAHVASASSGYNYDELEQEVAFLQDTGAINCRCIGCGDACNDADCLSTCCQTDFWEATLGCSKESSYSYEGPRNTFFTPGAVTIGSCEFNEDWFDYENPIEVKTTVWKEGVYTLTCTLHAGAHTCGHPFCEDMVLTSQGAIYWAEDLVSHTNPTFSGPDCWGDIAENKKAPVPGKGSKPSKRHLKGASKGAGKVTTKLVPGTTNPQETLFLGEGYIYSGPMYVSSRRFDVKYEAGWLDYSYSWWPRDTIDEAACEDKHLVHPYQFALKFSKPHTSSY